MEKAAFLEEIAALDAKVEAIRNDPELSKQDRYEGRSAIVKLANLVETPVEGAIRTLFETWPPLAALAVAINARWIHFVVESHHITASEISHRTGAEEQLIIRIMRVLCASGYVTSTGLNTYQANELTKAFATPGIADGYLHCCESVSIIFGHLPQYLASTGYKDPQSYKLGPHTFSFRRPLWDRIGSESRLTVQFNKFMRIVRSNRENFVDIFPFEERVKSVLVSPEDVVFIDIAGGVGHRVLQFRDRFPGIAGRAILQDLPHVLPSEQFLPEIFEELRKGRIETIGHDMLEPQPVRGARYYFFSAILHGWPDAECLKSLEQTVPAMKRGFSRILIYDWVIAEQDLDLFKSCVDLWMMANPTGRERTRKNWDALLTKVGLKIVEVHEKGADNILEVDLV